MRIWDSQAVKRVSTLFLVIGVLVGGGIAWLERSNIYWLGLRALEGGIAGGLFGLILGSLIDVARRGGRKGYITSISVGDGTVGLVSGRKTAAGVEVLRTGRGSLPGDFAMRPPEQRAEAIKSALAACGGEDRQIALVIPRAQAIVRDLEVPDGTMDELVQMVRFQLEKDFPIALDQVRYSFVVTSRNAGKARIQVAAVPREILDPLVTALEASDHTVTEAYVSTFGLLNLATGGDGAAAVVGASGSATEILVVDGGQVTVSRSTPIREGVPLADLLATEISRALLAHSARSPGRDVETILVASEDQALVNGIGAKVPQKVAALTLNGRLSRRSGLTLGLSEAANTGVCLGALVHQAPMPDLLHPPIVVKKFKFGKTYRIAALVATILTLGIVYMQMLLSDRNKQLSELKIKLDQIKPREAKVLRLSENLRRANQWDAKRYPWPRLIQEMSLATTTTELYVSSSTFEDGGTLRLTGKAKTEKNINAYLDRLQKLKYLQDLKIENERPGTDKGDFKFDFLITGRWVTPEE